MQQYIPLAEKLRPNNLSKVVGQTHLLQESGILFHSIQNQKPLSILLWGPAGCGKTTIAKLYAQAFQRKLITISAVSTGVADLKKIIHDIQSQPLFLKTPFLFIDEIHRYNKAQQDLILPYLERGTFLLLGATTENPSFSLNNALLSRLRVLELNALSHDDLEKLIQNYEQDFGILNINEESRLFLIQISQGDGRYLLNMVESLEGVNSQEKLSTETVKQLLQKKSALFDKDGDHHYNLISALHKSVRGSDPDASLYWLQRMLQGGEEPLFIARRLIRMASEDVGLADPQALQQAIAARDAYLHLGSPEGELALAQAVVYLALAPKSNALYLAFKSSQSSAQDTNHLSPPSTILNAPTKLMKELKRGEDYIYDHDTPYGFSGQNYFPKELPRQKHYIPVERGFEREMKKRIDFFNSLRLRS